jgi:FKBP-type peptidyl-prolyl cis-trans isomerase
MVLGRLLSLFRRGKPRPEFELPREEDLVVTDSGLGHRILVPGEGSAPCSTDTVTVRYAGWSTDGKLFDASYPGTATFPLNGVVAGWTEGLQLLRPGGEVLLVLPPSLAYGARGAPPRIGPDATLIFRVELVSVGG